VVLHCTGHYQATSPQRDQQIDPSHTGKTVLPTFTTRTEAQEEADQLNIINQSVIGAKEGVVEAILKLVGSDITDAILQTADGSDHKSINDFTL
jgi:hypothetical protein